MINSDRFHYTTLVLRVEIIKKSIIEVLVSFRFSKLLDFVFKVPDLVTHTANLQVLDSMCTVITVATMDGAAIEHPVSLSVLANTRIEVSEQRRLPKI